MKTPKSKPRLIETDSFPIEFLSQICERESWRKEIHRPVYHVHKWWAKRLGSVFRGILIASSQDKHSDLTTEFYKTQDFSGSIVFDPFMGSGTTIGEAHKLGFTALGRDINPVAVSAVRAALGPMPSAAISCAYDELDKTVGARIRALYQAKDAEGDPCVVLYYFWVMQARCPHCTASVDLFASYVFSQNAYPQRKPEVKILCPHCNDIFSGLHGDHEAECPHCQHRFHQSRGPARGQKAICGICDQSFGILSAIQARRQRPDFRLYAKLVLRDNGSKEYVRATQEDLEQAREASITLQREQSAGSLRLPDLALTEGHNTRQAMGYQFENWRDFFNDRQLLALGWLQAGIETLPDASARTVLTTLFSGLLEFNNLFASYKGEGTGAVRHMFSHHILKPERTPIEANVWGTPKSSGSFSGLFKGRLKRAIAYREKPTEVNGTKSAKGIVCSLPFAGILEDWPGRLLNKTRAIYLSCGDSAATGLPDKSIDLVVTDPPFFDNVHYSELADFFQAWHQFEGTRSTRDKAEVQDINVDNFAEKLRAVFSDCHRVLKDDGMLIFTYHHSREEGWSSVAQAVLNAGFTVVSSQPVKSEMSVAIPKLAAKEPIQMDIILVCRKVGGQDRHRPEANAIESARAQIARLTAAGFSLSLHDRKIILIGQMLTTKAINEIKNGTIHTESKVSGTETQKTLF